MDGVILLLRARRAGLRVTASGDTLVVRGPRRLEPIAQTLLAEKPRVLQALAEEHEVAWRVEAMRPQVSSNGAIPFLFARPDARWPVGRCCSCSDPLGPDERYRCRPCVAAAVAVLEGVR